MSALISECTVPVSYTHLELDVLYMTRVQKERFFNEEDYVRLKDFYILTKEKMELAKDDMIAVSYTHLDVYKRQMMPILQ